MQETVSRQTEPSAEIGAQTRADLQKPGLGGVRQEDLEVCDHADVTLTAGDHGADRAPANLTHFDADGGAHMVDVGDKPATRRRAIASGRIRMRPATASLIRAGAAAKGDVLGVARIAAIMAAKRTGEWIPLCHPLGLSHVAIEFDVNDDSVVARAVCEVTGPTGVEMEAMTAVSAALLTIYDMCKAVDRGMTIEAVRLLEKSGGRSGLWRADVASE